MGQGSESSLASNSGSRSFIAVKLLARAQGSTWGESAFMLTHVPVGRPWVLTTWASSQGCLAKWQLDSARESKREPPKEDLAFLELNLRTDIS